ncbi:MULTISPECIES: YfaZ family outer membrane protein [Marinobacter]|uniref:YfaZ family outer membrane protein n=1 Tax=Marinobacter TaxID=2742 RepID=UPI000DAD890A|nr:MULTISPECIES: YfaZ family outer membrane protein [Marinobacter]
MKYSRLSAMAFTLAAAAATPAMAADFDLSLTNDSAKGQINFMPNTADLQAGAGYTYHDGSRHIVNLDVHAQGRTAVGNLPTTAGIGFKGIGWDDDDLDGGAVGIGGFATMNIPRVPGLSVNGALHYAPSILSFGDSDDMTSVEARVSYRVIRNAEVFGGYRYLNTDLDSHGDINLDEGIMAGMKLYF